MDDLVESVLMDSNLELDFDSSCFNGRYVAGNITSEYLKALHDKRNDSAKQKTSDEDQVLDMHNDST